VSTLLAGLVFASGVQAADGVGTLQLRPGHWQVFEQIWLDGKEVLSALDEAAREINEGIRAELSPADREAFDREVGQRGSLNLESDCVSEAESRMNARAALEQMMSSLHAPPWSCSFRDERASSSGFEYRYSCRTAAGGRAEGQARFTLRGDSEYEGTIEGTSHAIDNASGPAEAVCLVERLRSPRRIDERQPKCGDTGPRLHLADHRLQRRAAKPAPLISLVDHKPPDEDGFLLDLGVEHNETDEFLVHSNDAKPVLLREVRLRDRDRVRRDELLLIR
jgi:hypothetical protein